MSNAVSEYCESRVFLVKFRLEGPGCSASGIATKKVSESKCQWPISTLVTTTEMSRVEPTGSTSEEQK